MSEPPHYAAIALAQTTGFSREECRIVLDLLKGIAARDGATGNFYASVRARMQPRDFSWPEFDRWQALFAERGEFPWLWDQLKTPPTLWASAELRRAYQEHKLYLLLHWLESLETARGQAHAALARYARRGVRAKIVRQADVAPCPVCDPLTHRGVEASPWTPPPFHPGCRCVVLAVTRVEGLSPARLLHSR